MTRVRKLGADDDFDFGAGTQNYFIDEPNVIAQNVKTALLLWRGEWFLNIEEGTPYLDGVLGKRSKDEADRSIRARILSVDGVTGIASYTSTLDPDARSLNINVTIDTVFGPTPVDMQNYLNY